MIATFENLGSNVVWCATHGLPALSRMTQFRSQSEVTDANLKIIGKEKVPQLEVTVDHHLLLEILYSQ